MIITERFSIECRKQLDNIIITLGLVLVLLQFEIG